MREEIYNQYISKYPLFLTISVKKRQNPQKYINLIFSILPSWKRHFLSNAWYLSFRVQGLDKVSPPFRSLSWPLGQVRLFPHPRNPEPWHSSSSSCSCFWRLRMYMNWGLTQCQGVLMFHGINTPNLYSDLISRGSYYILFYSENTEILTSKAIYPKSYSKKVVKAGLKRRSDSQSCTLNH